MFVDGTVEDLVELLFEEAREKACEVEFTNWQGYYIDKRGPQIPGNAVPHIKRRKLTPDAVRDIRSKAVGQRVYAKKYGIDRCSVRKVQRRQTYKEVED